MPSPLANNIINYLVPTVGDFLAQSSVKAACHMAKLDIESLDKSHLPQFMDKFKLVCATSFGSEVTKRITEKIMTF